MSFTLVSLIIAVMALFLGGFAKGISGMGLPTITTPILTVLFDLQTAIVLAVPATVITDLLMILATPKNWGLVRRGLPLMVFGICGVFIGSLLLILVNPDILTGIFATVILLYVVTSLFSLLPKFRAVPWMDGVVGLVGGAVQGAVGASGPIISIYMLQLKMSRYDFLFLLNMYFFAVDAGQFVSLYHLGHYSGAIVVYSLLALLPTGIGLAIAFRVHKRISDHWFRNAILLLMTASGVLLLGKSVGF